MIDKSVSDGKGRKGVAKGGRPPKGAPVDRIAKLRAELAAAEAEAKEAEDAKALIVGRAVIEAMKAAPAFKVEVEKHLKDRVKKSRDFAAISNLLGT